MRYIGFISSLHCLVQFYVSLGYTMVASRKAVRLIISFSCLIVVAVVAVDDAILIPTFFSRVTEGPVTITHTVIFVAVAVFIEDNDKDHDDDDDTDDDSNR